MAAAKWLVHLLRMPLVAWSLVVLALFTVVWSFIFVNMALLMSPYRSRDSGTMKAELVQLSEEYIKALAKDNGDIVDGPYANKLTAFDLKRTLAVLLESMLARITQLEAFISTISNESVLIDRSSLSLTSNLTQLRQREALQEGSDTGTLIRQELLQNQYNKCELTDEDKLQYPLCTQKIEWMRQMWKSDSCYQGYGVDGSDCSFIRYLSEVEEFCPRPAWLGSQTGMQVKNANFTLDLEPLLNILLDPNDRQSYAFIRLRISQMWHQWKKAATNIMAKYHNSRPKQKILLHLGLLSNTTGWEFAEKQFKGGPLGELVQWSDLIATLYILGHELTITSEVEQLIVILNNVPAAKTPCQSRKELPVHLMYTDIIGLDQFKKALSAGYPKFSCLIRVMDTFGTEPAFNHKGFARKNKISTSWGGHDLNPQQFFTMFPHTPDNSFMGFVVDRFLNDSQPDMENKSNVAVVYGKNDFMWKGKRDYLDAIHSRLEVHGTVYTEPGQKLMYVPEYVVNHGLLSRMELHKLLQKAKWLENEFEFLTKGDSENENEIQGNSTDGCGDVIDFQRHFSPIELSTSKEKGPLRNCVIFVGLGFPYEGPAVLEAIANGAVFLNPEFDPPLSRNNNIFFKGKPTQREITSQHPYAETFIGEPYVYTVDINKTGDVAAIVDKILSRNQFLSYLPHEFTEEGMLQRMNSYIQNQNFCSFKRDQVKWPPRSSVGFILAELGKSCKDACWALNRICEPRYFSELNSQESFSNFTMCHSVAQAVNIYYPAIDVTNKTCITQDEPLLFSCVGSMSTLQRLCPCRTYIEGQTALCVGCDS